MWYSGWSIDSAVRKQLLSFCPPTHSEVRCDHVTEEVGESIAEHPGNAEIVIYGMFDDGAVQALAVIVNGATHNEAGTPYHITVSHVATLPSYEVGPRMLRDWGKINRIAAYPLIGTGFVQPLGGKAN